MGLAAVALLPELSSLSALPAVFIVQRRKRRHTSRNGSRTETRTCVCVCVWRNSSSDEGLGKHMRHRIPWELRAFLPSPFRCAHNRAHGMMHGPCEAQASHTWLCDTLCFFRIALHCLRRRGDTLTDPGSWSGDHQPGFTESAAFRMAPKIAQPHRCPLNPLCPPAP